MTDYIENNLPDPDEVARAAAEACAPRVLEDYIEAIETLRDKKFTFREIADWLGKKFSIQADHNSVWRAYTKHMNEFEAHQEAEADEELERDEAIEYSNANGMTESITPNTALVAEVATDTKVIAEVPITGLKRAKKKK